MALPDNLISYYNLNGNSNDSVNSNNGTDTSVSYSASYGKLSSGASYSSGSSSKTSIASNANLDFTSALTISGWINPQSFATPCYMITKFRSSSWSSGGGGQWMLRVNDANNIEANIYLASLTGAVATGLSLTTGTWYHVCFTYDGSNIVIYLNGSSVKTQAASGSISAGSFGADIGGNSLAGEYGSQYLDEIGIWSRALSSAEITQLYNSGGALGYPFPSSTLSAKKQLLGVGI